MIPLLSRKLVAVNDRIFLRLMPARHRSYLEFAEQEIIMPTGPKEGRPFRASYMPFSRFVLEEFSRGVYSEFYGSGPVQSGKTTLFYVIPALYHLFELKEDVILGAPISDMAKSAYEERLLPVIMKSRYREFLPLSGGGSRGGKADSIRFGHGPRIRFLGAGGGDQQIASYTARVVVATELDKMDEPGKVSREADPVTKLKARTKAYGREARFFGECTMSTPEGRIYQEVVHFGSDTRVALPCVHCGRWILPERAGLVGWQDAEDVIQAQAKATFLCPACGKGWSEEDRRRSIENPRVVSKGQEVLVDGTVAGDPPKTQTFGFRWNVMSSPMRSIAEVAAEEWKAQQSGNTALEKGVVQFAWAEPWQEDLADLSRPEVATILAKIVGHQRGVIPPGTVKVTLGLDVGSYVIWWTLWAWTADGQGHLVDFGGIDVPLVGGVKNPTAVLAALRAFRDNVIKPGWAGRQPDRILIDSGYETDVVYEFVRESLQPRFLACKGFGTSSRHGGWRDPAAMEPSPTRTVGTGYYSVLQPHGVHLVHVNGDHFKAAVHDGFWAAHGAPGSLTIWHGEKTDPELRKFARQIVAEQRTVKTVGEKEAKVVWVVQQRQNHYLDCSAYARCAAEIEGVRVARAAGVVKMKVRPAAPASQEHRIRTKY